MLTSLPALTGVDNRWLVGMLAVGLMAFYALAFDQGLILSFIQGSVAFDQNIVHEIVHDARHAAGFPCH